MINPLKKLMLIIEAIYYRFTFKTTANQRSGVKIFNCEDSIRYILETRCSVSRYGDGELSMIFNQYDTRERKSHFQRYDRDLAKRLEEILTNVEDDRINHKIGLPGCILNPSYMTGRARRCWERYAVINFKLLDPFIDKNTEFLDACFTRFYIEHKNKSQAITLVNSMKEIWRGRNIIIVEGEKTRLGVGNDLFSEALSIKRILCPSTNAWSKCEDILDLIKTLIPSGNDCVLLLALGMTATVLAYDLAKLGYQAIDIGHVDIEYEWMLRKAKSKIPIPGKYTNESKSLKFIEAELDSNYAQSIIGQIP